MVTVQKSTVFKEYRPYHRILAAFNPDNYNEKPLYQKLRNVCFAMCVAAVLITIAFLIILSCWRCVENISIEIVALALPLELTFTQFLLTQISLMVKNGLIRATIENLQKTVDQREFHSPPVSEFSSESLKSLVPLLLLQECKNPPNLQQFIIESRLSMQWSLDLCFVHLTLES